MAAPSKDDTTYVTATIGENVLTVPGMAAAWLIGAHADWPEARIVAYITDESLKGPDMRQLVALAELRTNGSPRVLTFHRDGDQRIVSDRDPLGNEADLFTPIA